MKPVVRGISSVKQRQAHWLANSCSESSTLTISGFPGPLSDRIPLFIHPDNGPGYICAASYISRPNSSNLMSDALQPLWQLLLKSNNLRPSSPLTCADCFSILEYLADLSQDFSISEKQQFIHAARKHLSGCPDCRRYYQAKLDELEAIMMIKR